MGSTPTLHLYIDDTGTRCPNIKPSVERKDKMDHFAFGGYLVFDYDVKKIEEHHQQLKQDFALTTPLHSTAIRGKRRGFNWLNKDDDKVRAFYKALNTFIIEAPIYATACVIDRPGYDKRYRSRYGNDRWQLCKSAYSILIERSAKFAASQSCKLAVYVEHTGKRENTLLKQYHRDIYDHGMPFNPSTSGQYNPLGSNDFSNILFKNPNFMPKDSARLQLADLVAYAIAKGQYDPEYRSFRELHDRNKLIDNVLGGEAIAELGIKRYCFDD